MGEPNVELFLESSPEPMEPEMKRETESRVLENRKNLRVSYGAIQVQPDDLPVPELDLDLDICDFPKLVFQKKSIRLKPQAVRYSYEEEEKCAWKITTIIVAAAIPFMIFLALTHVGEDPNASALTA